MSYVIKLLHCMVPVPTEHDGRYVVEYLPAAMDENGDLHGGRLITTADLDKAQRFDDAAEAFECWCQKNGTRPDGKDNRPLTAWTAEIADEKDLQ